MAQASHGMRLKPWRVVCFPKYRVFSRVNPANESLKNGSGSKRSRKKIRNSNPHTDSGGDGIVPSPPLFSVRLFFAVEIWIVEIQHKSERLTNFYD